MKAYAWHFLVRRDAPKTQTEGGIHLPETSAPGFRNVGTVVSVGHLAGNHEHAIEEGTRVWFTKAVLVIDEQEGLVAVEDDDIVAVQP